MKAMKCVVCGYVYNENIGDIEHGIEVGTTYEELPDDWLCPVCAVGKDKFEEIEY